MNIKILIMSCNLAFKYSTVYPERIPDLKIEKEVTPQTIVFQKSKQNRDRKPQPLLRKWKKRSIFAFRLIDLEPFTSEWFSLYNQRLKAFGVSLGSVTICSDFVFTKIFSQAPVERTETPDIPPIKIVYETLIKITRVCFKTQKL